MPGQDSLGRGLGRGLTDDPLSLSNEMRCRGRVLNSAALSEKLCEIGWAARGTVDDCAKRVSGVVVVVVVVEGRGGVPSALPLLLLLGRVPVAERPAGDMRR